MTSDFSVNMNEYLPLRDVVFNTLRQAILKGELKPGERLMEIALAERLGVSRTPIREAMRKLEQEGLVVMIPRRGAQVANITEKDLNDVLEVRIALENVAIEKACARMTEEEMRRLWLAAKEFEHTIAEGNLVKLAEADVAFHEVIYQASDNKRLIQVLNNMREQIYRYRVEYLKEGETQRRSESATWNARNSFLSSISRIREWLSCVLLRLRMQNVNVQRKRNPGDTDKNGIISEYREILREAGCLSFFAHPCVYK